LPASSGAIPSLPLALAADPTYAERGLTDSLKANICGPKGVTGAHIIEIVSDRKTGKADIVH
jgi:hypothetical protein